MEGQPSFRFKREERLKGRSRIREVFGKGKRYYAVLSGNQGVRLFVLNNNLPYNRICFTFAKGRRFGSAVARNRIKRLAREAYRLIKGEYQDKLALGRDFILLFYPNQDEAARAKSSPQALPEMTELLKSLYKKAGLLTNGAKL